MKVKKFILTVLLIGVLFAEMVVPSFATTTGVVSVTSGNLNMRSGAGTSYSIVTPVPKGATVTILETVNGTDSSASSYPTWYKVTYNSYTGYVATSFISNVTSDTPTDPGLSDEVPAIYRTYIQNLKALHPNWSFQFYDTGLEWADVIAGETKLGKNAISNIRPISYRSTTVGYSASNGEKTGVINGSDGKLNVRNGASTSNTSIIAVLPNETVVTITETVGNWYHINCTYNGQAIDGFVYSSYVKNVTSGNGFTPIEGTSWFQAHGQVIQYYMDPRNSLTDDIRVFQFEKLSFDSGSQTLSGVQSILSGSFMDGRTITTTDSRTITYAEAIMEAAQTYGVSPYHLASRIIQEVGKTNPSVAATGDGYEGNYVGIYNFYNIGANTGVKDGLNWAYNGGVAGSYGTPWNSQYKSIMGGAEYIAKKYISIGQNTLYYEKFDVIANGGLYNHQYMSNVEAVYNESKNVFNGYNSLGILNNSFVFVIPVYRNMPATVCALPASSTSPNLASDLYIATTPTPDPDPTPTPDPTPDPNPDYMKGGDVSGNGKIDLKDARMILQYCTEEITFTAAQFNEGDVSGDNRISIKDAKMILDAITSDQPYVSK